MMQNAYDAEAEQIARRKKYAEMLRQTAMEPLQGQMVSGHYVGPHWAQGLAQLGKAWLGGREARAADQAQKDLDARKQQAYISTLRGMPVDTPVETPATFGDSDIPTGVTTTTGRQAPSDAQWAEWAGNMGQFGPSGAAVAQMMYGAQEKRADREDRQKAAAQAAQQAREQRMADLQMRMEDARISREERAALQRELVQMQNQARQDMVRLTASMRPAPAPTVIQGETGPMILGRNGTARPVVDARGNPVAGKSTEKALPTSAAQKLFDNRANLRKAEQALDLISGKEVGDTIGDAQATGWKGFLPDTLLQRMDPSGVATRAAIADLGSMVIHDRSGAAVTAAEFPRLKPFIPTFTDDPATVKKKLGRFVQEYRNLVDESTEFFRESGYKVPTGQDAEGDLTPDELRELNELRARFGRGAP